MDLRQRPAPLRVEQEHPLDQQSFLSNSQHKQWWQVWLELVAFGQTPDVTAKAGRGAQQKWLTEACGISDVWCLDVGQRKFSAVIKLSVIISIRTQHCLMHNAVQGHHLRCKSVPKFCQSHTLPQMGLYVWQECTHFILFFTTWPFQLCVLLTTVSQVVLLRRICSFFFFFF